ncbi:MAG: hypothetical protein ACFB0B_03300 [Thermonemataceae bacterium]
MILFPTLRKIFQNFDLPSLPLTGGMVGVVIPEGSYDFLVIASN